MKITNIKQQVKTAGRYSVYVDDKYAFSLSESALLETGVAGGQELTQEQLAEYKQLSADDKIYSRALRYVAMRSRSTWELKTYLQRKDASEDVIAKIVQKLTRAGLLDDAAYAMSFVRDRQQLKPSSRRKLMLELKKKHIANEYATAALEAAGLDERANLRQLIANKRRQTKYHDDIKLMQYLARQGFSYGDIKAAMNPSIDE